MYYIINNPRSGNGQGNIICQNIQEAMRQHDLDFKVLESTCSGEAAALATAACLCPNCQAILAIGGDGTFNEVLNGHDLSLPLALIPAGTGNDLARVVPLTNDPETICQLLLNNQTRSIDFLQVNEKRCINAFGTGIDVAILRNENRLRRFFKRTSYLLGLIKTIMPIHFYSAHLEINAPAEQETSADPIIFDGEITEIVAANGRYLGNGFLLAPDATWDDGLIDVVILTRVPRRQIPSLLLSFLKGQISDCPYYSVYHCKSLICSVDNYPYYQIDGEIFADLPAKISMHSGELQLFLPDN